MKFNIYTYILITVCVLIGYITSEYKSYRASWRVHLFAFAFPLFLLLTQKLNSYSILFIYTILIWHIVDLTYVIYNNKLSTIQ